MSKKNNKNSKIETNVEKRPIDIHFQNLDEQLIGNKYIYAILLYLTFFGIMGLIWMIPFPQLEILRKMNAQTFLNWGSFYIAIVIYCYLKLAPTLSYAMLFTISIMSFFIVQLEYVERDGGPSVVMVCGILSLIGLFGLWSFTRKSKNLSLSQFWTLLTIGPIWLWSKVFDRFNIKY